MSYFGATDTPILDSDCKGKHNVRSLRSTFHVTPADLFNGQLATSQDLQYFFSSTNLKLHHNRCF